MEAERSPYKDLLKDREFKRWIDNVTRGSKSYGYEMLRRMGFIQKRFKKSPSQIAKMTQKQAANFILDMIGELEKEKRSGSYMSGSYMPRPKPNAILRSRECFLERISPM